MAPYDYLYDYRTEYNRKFKAYEVIVFAKTIGYIQPLGGTGKDKEGIWPVEVVKRETKDTVTVAYAGTGMGDGAYQFVAFKTPEGAYADAVRILGAMGKKVLTDEQLKGLVQGRLDKQIKDAQRKIKELEEKVNKLKVKWVEAKLEG